MIGDRLREILFFFRHNLAALLLVTLPFAAASSLLAHQFGEPFSVVNDKLVYNAPGALALVLLYPLALAAEVIAIHRLARQEPLAIGSLLVESLQAWPVFAVLSLVTGLAVGAGLLVFILPGVWLYSRLGLAPVIAAAEHLGPGDALAAAWRRSEAEQFEWLSLLMVVVLGALLVLTAVFSVIEAAGATETLGGDLLARAADELVFSLATITFYRRWSLAGSTP